MSEDQDLVSVDDLAIEPFIVDEVNVKLLTLLDLSEYMEPIKLAIRLAYGTHFKERHATNIVGKLMSAHSHCWAVFSREDPRLLGFMIADIRRSDLFDAQGLYISLISLMEGVRLSENAYRQCLGVLKSYAEQTECAMLFAETINMDLAHVAGKLGFTCFAAILKMDLTDA